MCSNIPSVVSLKIKWNINKKLKLKFGLYLLGYIHFKALYCTSAIKELKHLRQTCF